MMQRGRELTLTAMSVTPAEAMVSTLAEIIVKRLPIESNTAPQIILPRPLQTDKTPTKDTARDSGAFTERARSFAKLITELPTAARKEMQIKAIEELSQIEDLNELDAELESLTRDFEVECEGLLKEVIYVNKKIFENMVDEIWENAKEKAAGGAANV